MDARTNTGLQIIFSVFLGLMVAAFFGVGVFTFYPPPEAELQEQLEDLYREQEDIGGFDGREELSREEREREREVRQQIRDIEDRLEERRETWGRNTSIILVTFATIVMSISLIRADQLPVISNGLLLGGVFTMIYGVGWIIATGTSIARFVVMTIALAITLALGYVRFVRTKRARAGEEAAGAAAAGMPPTGELDEIERRLRTLEQRMDAAAVALGSAPDRPADHDRVREDA